RRPHPFPRRRRWKFALERSRLEVRPSRRRTYLLRKSRQVDLATRTELKAKANLERLPTSPASARSICPLGQAPGMEQAARMALRALSRALGLVTVSLPSEMAEVAAAEAADPVAPFSKVVLAMRLQRSRKHLKNALRQSRLKRLLKFYSSQSPTTPRKLAS